MERFIHKKSLGQNFLKTESILDLIASSGDIREGDTILEIGPGEGALTKKILEKISFVNKARLVCIEKDHRLIPILQEKFSREIEQGSLELLEEDILKWSIDKYVLSKAIKDNSGTFKYKLIANIPYYITGAIMEQFLSADNKPECIIVMVQKEVAERVVAKNGKQSILALCTKYYGDSEIIKIVKPGNFNPPPKIDSAVLKITLRPNILNIKNLTKKEEEKENKLEKTYLHIVKKGLAHKRKKLSSNLKDFDKKFGWPELFAKLGLDTNVRGEDLDYEKFLGLAKKYLNML